MTGLRVGVIILPQFTAREAAPRWKSLQERGFAHGWTYDHLAWRSLADEPWYSTTLTLAVAAQATTTLPIGTWVASPNFRHPVTFAKDLLSLDDLSDGRIIATIGAGGLGWDADVLGQPELSPRQRVDRLTEFVELTDLLLRQGETSHQGEYFTADRARMYPAGSRARIRMVLAGNGPRSVRLAARYDGWATTAAPGSDPDTWWQTLRRMAELFDSVAEPGTPRYVSMDSLPEYDFGSFEFFADAAGRVADLGFTDAVIHWPRASGVYAGVEVVLDRIADRLSDGQFSP